jgi:uncharacterized BrkB/YihY/UPF0761 family membrane protein
VKALSDASSNGAVRTRLGGGRSVAQRATRDGWRIIKDTAYGFIADEALSRGAAIAFYTATSLAPVLLIVVAIAGLVFGHDAAQNAITGQLSELMGDQTAERPFGRRQATGRTSRVATCRRSADWRHD